MFREEEKNSLRGYLAEVRVVIARGCAERDARLVLEMDRLEVTVHVVLAGERLAASVVWADEGLLTVLGMGVHVSLEVEGTVESVGEEEER